MSAFENGKPQEHANRINLRKIRLPLIRKLHGFMSAQQLLVILNDRLFCALGQEPAPYTMEQRYAEIGEDAVTARRPHAGLGRYVCG